MGKTIYKGRIENKTKQTKTLKTCQQRKETNDKIINKVHGAKFCFFQPIYWSNKFNIKKLKKQKTKFSMKVNI